jgi:hypothetical protein
MHLMIRARRVAPLRVRADDAARVRIGGEAVTQRRRNRWVGPFA